MIKPGIGIDQHLRDKSIKMLSTMLSNEMMLHVKTRKFHWNVSGESFMELHKLFESEYNQLEVAVDEIAERVGKLGEHTMGTMKEFKKFSTLKEHAGQYSSTKESIKELLEDNETLIVELREGLGVLDKESNDVGTIDFLIKLIQQHESTAWILRRYLN